MNKVKVKNVVLGEGIPKICVSITGKGKKEIFREAEKIKKLPIDVAEWRADWFDGVLTSVSIKEILAGLQEILKEIPLIFTFRTLEEGGEKAIDTEDYITLSKEVVETGLADLIDIQQDFAGEKDVKEMIGFAHEKGVKVIVSNHDFHKTPAKEELIERLCKMQELGADILKIAVMPKAVEDVITLLSATEEMNEKYADRPIVTISMSDIGTISRIAGEWFGSAITFAAAEKPSAPGQMAVTELRDVMQYIHENCFVK